MAKTTAKSAGVADQQRQKLRKELALVAIAPILLYLLASMIFYTSADPGWSRTGSLDGSIHNIGGVV
nr:DNA translocase FtsK 4TM domain-containing protein [Arenimonas sp.]